MRPTTSCVRVDQFSFLLLFAARGAILGALTARLGTRLHLRVVDLVAALSTASTCLRAKGAHLGAEVRTTAPTGTHVGTNLAHGNAVLEQLKMTRFHMSATLLETMGKCSHARGVTRSAAVGAIDVLLMLVSHVSVGGNFK
jgi:hypothetical protein